MSEQILIIKHGALGDIMLASGHLKAIRAAHPTAHITCLTGKAYVGLMESCPWIDTVWTDTKPRGIGGWLTQLKLYRTVLFDWVYDLQTSDRSTLYTWLLRYKNWSGIGARATHPQRGTARLTMHTIARLNDQLRLAGINTDGTPDISWMTADTSRFGLPSCFALLVAGGSAHRPEKRWPVAHYITLAERLVAADITPVLIGTAAEAALLDAIAAAIPAAKHLGNLTSFADVASLARSAIWAVGNDTGPMHIIAAAGCACTVIFSQASSPEKSAPLGAHVRVLQHADLAQLTPESVWATFNAPKHKE